MCFARRHESMTPCSESALGIRSTWCLMMLCSFFFFSSRRRHTIFDCDWSSDVCSSDLLIVAVAALCFGVALYFGASRTSAEREHGNHDWPNHGKDLANTRFQSLDQINPSNVKNLQVAWVFHTGVLDPLSELEASPIEVDGRLFITDGHDDVFALNATTRSEEHTSELQSQSNLVCRLLLEKKKTNTCQ